MMNEPVVLFATDLDGDVAEGISVASRLAAERSATLLIVHVVPLRKSDGEGMLHAAVDLRSNERTLRAASRRAVGVPHRVLLQVGEPEVEIARVAEESGASLVVLEARARGALRRLLFGRSLVERLAARVDCPVQTFEPRSAGSFPEPTVDARSAHSPSLALQAVLDERVDAVVAWLDARARAGASIAQRPSIQQAVARLAGRRSSWATQQIRDELMLELGERLHAIDAVGVEIWCDNTRGIEGAHRSGANPLLALGVRARPGPELHGWIGAVMRGDAAVSLPLDAADPEEAPVVLAGARMSLPGGNAAALVVSFDARPGFLRILGQPGPSSSAETYAFDGQGLMLSNSRFPTQLRHAGLLAASAQAARRVRVADPGTNLLDAPLPDEREAWPLTQMAASATAGHAGVDVQGYRDYRGVPVIGAWRWIPTHGFGVAAEMDVTEARELQFRQAS